MALQELSPLPPVTGYSSLGAAISNLGQDQLQRSRQLQDEARRRAQQLQDVASARDYASTEGDKRRYEQLQDTQTLDKFRAQQAGIQLLINEGYLDGSQRDNPAAVQAAYQQAKADGVDKRYLELYQTPDPDTGRPLLTPGDAGNAALVQAAKDKLGAIKAKQVQFQMGQPANAQATVNDIQQQLAQIRAQKQAVVQAANQPAPQYSPNDPKVVALAQQLAEQTKPGSGRNRDAVAAQMPAAYKQLNDQALMAWSQNVQSAKIELESLRRSEAEYTDQLVRLSQTFKVAPSERPTVSAPQAAAPAAPRAASADDIAAAMRAAIGAPQTTNTAPSGRSLLDNPTNDPTIGAANDEIKEQQAQTVKDSLNAALAESDAIDQKIAAARHGQLDRPSFPSYSPMGIPLQPAQSTRIDAGLAVSDLLKAKAANAAKVQALQAQLVGPVQATASAPAVNTPTTSTPTIGAAQTPAAWWARPNPGGVGPM